MKVEKTEVQLMRKGNKTLNIEVARTNKVFCISGCNHNHRRRIRDGQEEKKRGSKRHLSKRIRDGHEEKKKGSKRHLSKLNQIWMSQHISNGTKTKVLGTLVSSEILNDFEAWTMKEVHENMLQVFEKTKISLRNTKRVTR